MADTNFSALTTQEKMVWARDTWKVARNRSFINLFTGTSENSMIQRITELTKTEKGTKAVMTLVPDLQDDGVTGDNLLEGNESEMKAFDEVIQIDQLRNAVRSRGRVAEQSSIVNFRKQARNQLGYWLGDRIDQMAFLTLSGLAYTLHTNGATRAVNPTGQNLNDLEFAADVLAPTANRALRVEASGIVDGTGFSAAAGALRKLRYGDIVQMQATARERFIKPVMGKNGEEIYHMFLTPQGMADLKLDPDFIANVRHAGVRGDKNSLFKGTSKSVMVDGVMIHEFHHVFDTRGAAAGSKMGTTGADEGQRALLCGAQALGMCDLNTASWDEEEFNYKNQPGIAYGKIFGLLKPQFKGNPVNFDTKEDFGVLTLDTAL